MVMEDFNLLNYNQQQFMKREPILVRGPNLVFLAPTKKGLTSPILKYKTQLASRSSHVSLHIKLCWSTSSHNSLLVNLLINTTGQSLFACSFCSSTLLVLSSSTTALIICSITQGSCQFTCLMS